MYGKRADKQAMRRQERRQLARDGMSGISGTNLDGYNPQAYGGRGFDKKDVEYINSIGGDGKAARQSYFDGGGERTARQKESQRLRELGSIDPKTQSISDYDFGEKYTRQDAKYLKSQGFTGDQIAEDYAARSGRDRIGTAIGKFFESEGAGENQSLQSLAKERAQSYKAGRDAIGGDKNSSTNKSVLENVDNDKIFSENEGSFNNDTDVLSNNDRSFNEENFSRNTNSLNPFSNNDVDNSVNESPMGSVFTGPQNITGNTLNDGSQIDARDFSINLGGNATVNGGGVGGTGKGGDGRPVGNLDINTPSDYSSNFVKYAGLNQNMNARGAAIRDTDKIAENAYSKIENLGDFDGRRERSLNATGAFGQNFYDQSEFINSLLYGDLKTRYQFTLPQTKPYEKPKDTTSEALDNLNA